MNRGESQICVRYTFMNGEDGKIWIDDKHTTIGYVEKTLKQYIIETFGWCGFSVSMQRLDTDSNDPYTHSYLIIKETLFSKFSEEYPTTHQKTIHFYLKNFIQQNKISELDLTEIYTHHGITKVPSHAFTYCCTLRRIILPPTVVCIEDNAFYKCTNLIDIYVPDSVETIEKYAFYGCSALTSFKVPSKVTVIDTQTFGQCVSLQRVSLHENITTIGAYAFERCGLDHLIIPASVCEIGMCAFNGCKLQTVYFSGSVKVLSSYVFKNCSNLIRVDFPRNQPSVERILCSAFEGCTALKKIHLPTSVQMISSDVFFRCKCLQHIYLPSGVDLKRAHIPDDCHIHRTDRDPQHKRQRVTCC